MEEAAGNSARGSQFWSVNPQGEAEELQNCRGGDSSLMVDRTPYFEAVNASRYERQELVRQYQDMTGANLIVIIDQIYPDRMTLLEDLLYDCHNDKDLHVLLSSPGGDGETALRMARVLHEHSKELTIIVPDMAKSAATILCLGADHILMGPAGDLGPIDPQMILSDRKGMSSAKEIVAAVDEAERRVNDNPNAFPLFASLLSDVNMLMVESARNALNRSEALMREALSAVTSRDAEMVDKLAKELKAPLIEDPSSHSADISSDDALGFGLPIIKADTASPEWKLLWKLWTRFYVMHCFPAGTCAVYEGIRASQVFS